MVRLIHLKVAYRFIVSKNFS